MGGLMRQVWVTFRTSPWIEYRGNVVTSRTSALDVVGVIYGTFQMQNIAEAKEAAGSTVIYCVLCCLSHIRFDSVVGNTRRRRKFDVFHNDNSAVTESGGFYDTDSRAHDGHSAVCDPTTQR